MTQNSHLSSQHKCVWSVMVPSYLDQGYQVWEVMKQGSQKMSRLCSFFPSIPHSCFLLVRTFPRRKGMISSALDTLFLLSSYSAGIFWSHQKSFPLVLQTALILPDTSAVCSTRFILILQILLLSHVLLHFLQQYHKPPSAYLWIGILFIHLSLLVLQTAISSISTLQIAHTMSMVLLV